MIISYYSYKGGVGRTQLVANVASYLCYYKNKKILLLEWDLEAPGLHYYFGKTDSDIQQTGLIELLYEYTDLMNKGGKVAKEQLNYFKEEHIVTNLITSKKGGKVDLIPAAKYAEPYTQKINDFDWRAFMEFNDGFVYMDFLKQQLKELDYDYIFIDSRTGISDYSGICNILLPDANVMVIAPTEQNFTGTLKITNAILDHPFVKDQKRLPHILPILSRIDMEASNVEYWINRFETDFSFVLKPSLPENLKPLTHFVFRDIYRPETSIHYNRNIAIGENILFSPEKRAILEGTTAKIFQNIASYIERFSSETVIDMYSKLTPERLDIWLEEIDDDNKFIDIGDVYSSLGLIQKAKELYETSNTTFLHLLESDPKNNDYKHNLAISYERLGNTYTDLGNTNEALAYYQKQLKLVEELHKSNQQKVVYKRDLAVAYSKMGDTHTALGKTTEALAFYENDLKLSTALHDTYPQELDYKRGLAIAYSRLGETHTTLGNTSESLAFYENCLELSTALHDAYPQQVAYKRDLAVAYSKMGETYTTLGNITEALTYYENYLKLSKALHEAYPQQVDYKRGLAVAYEKLGDTHTVLGKTAEALDYYQKELKLFEELYDAYPQQVNFKNGLAVANWKLGDFYRKQNVTSKAREFFLACQKVLTELIAQAPLHQEYKDNLKEVEEDLAKL